MEFHTHESKCWACRGTGYKLGTHYHCTACGGPTYAHRKRYEAANGEPQPWTMGQFKFLGVLALIGAAAAGLWMAKTAYERSGRDEQRDREAAAVHDAMSGTWGWMKYGCGTAAGKARIDLVVNHTGVRARVELQPAGGATVYAYEAFGAIEYDGRFSVKPGMWLGKSGGTAAYLSGKVNLRDSMLDATLQGVPCGTLKAPRTRAGV